MDGVIILNTIDHVERSWGVNSTVLILWGVLAVCVLIGVLICKEVISDEHNVLLSIVCVVGGIFFFISIVCFSHGKVTKEWTTYEAIFSETLTMHDFNTKYEMVGRHGGFYEIKEIDWDERQLEVHLSV